VGIARKICEADAFVRSGAWLSGHSFPLGVKVSGKRLGILGMGRIGQEIAARAAAFKMRVSYHSRRKASVPFFYYDSLLDLAKNSDFLGIPNPIQIRNPEVHHQTPLSSSRFHFIAPRCSLLLQSSSVLEVLPHITW
jgi:lactate dehydrogenase-like 2-hydroxyacid dehydrogenase